MGTARHLAVSLRRIRTFVIYYKEGKRLGADGQNETEQVITLT